MLYSAAQMQRSTLGAPLPKPKKEKIERSIKKSTEELGIEVSKEWQDKGKKLQSEDITKLVLKLNE